jgi:hypothetical protein
MKYVFFWVFPRRLSANSRRFGTLYRSHLQRQVKEDLPLKMEPIQCPETSAISTQTPGKHPKENIFKKVIICTSVFNNTYLIIVFDNFHVAVKVRVLFCPPFQYIYIYIYIFIYLFIYIFYGAATQHGSWHPHS